LLKLLLAMNILCLPLLPLQYFLLKLLLAMSLLCLPLQHLLSKLMDTLVFHLFILKLEIL
jgi:hypothetical protein